MKKFLIVSGVFFVGLFGGFFLIGILSPEVSYDSEVLVNKPLGQSWEVFTDPARTAEWLEGFQARAQVSGEPGKLGSKVKMAFVEEGQTIYATEEIINLIPRQQFDFVLEAEVLSTLVKVSFFPEGDQTRILAKSVVHGKNPIYRSMFVILKGTFAKQDQITYENLKAVIEAS